MVDAVLDDLDVKAKAPPAQFGPPGSAASKDPLALIIAGKRWEGWQRVVVARGMETIPASFDVQVTERYPLSGQIDIKPGDPVQVKIGEDLAITGFVDRYAVQVSPNSHTVRITGRSKSQDLVDGAAFVGDPENETYQIPPGNTVSIIQQLAKGYGVEVKSEGGDGVPITQPININLGETAWEIMDRLISYSGLIAYDMPDGSLLLSKAGKEQMASGFVQGVNIESAEVTFSMDQRFSKYLGFKTSTVSFTLGAGQMTTPDAVERDELVPRFRKRIIISAQVSASGEDLIKKRVVWEKNRRYGRSRVVSVTCDSWRDAKGALWAPNHLAPVELPALKLPKETLCIGAVTYARDENGQHATLVLMPTAAFEPEPTVFQPLPPTLADIGAAGGPGNPNSTNNPTAPDPAGPSTDDIISKGAT